jgi:hypothetical protein
MKLLSKPLQNVENGNAWAPADHSAAHMGPVTQSGVGLESEAFKLGGCFIACIGAPSPTESLQSLSSSLDSGRPSASECGSIF